MNWRALLTQDEERVLPWLGGGTVRLGARTWFTRRPTRRGGTQPREHDWYRFKLSGQHAEFLERAEPDYDLLTKHATGYLVGDRFLSDQVRVDPDPRNIASLARPVHLIEQGLGRFERVIVGSATDFGEHVYAGRSFAVGPEPEVEAAFEDGKTTVATILHVPPALDAAFRMAVWQRFEADRRRRELEAFEAELVAEAELAARRAELAKTLGTAEGRRKLAETDFAAAAKAALAVGGAEYLSHRVAIRHHEFAVRYCLLGRRFECVCDQKMRIIDSGICLADHRTGERGDARFTLESLPSVVREADRRGVLTVFRHV